MLVSLFYQNVRGLRTKTTSFLKNLLKNNYDIVCLSETWLLPGINDAELFDSRYNVYRTDRDYERVGLKMGGGTLIAVHRALVTNIFNIIRPLPVFPDTEITQINITLGRGPTFKNLRLFCCYFPQNPHQHWSQQQFFEFLSDLNIDNPTDEFLVVGDFNIRNAEWQSYPGILIYNILNTTTDQLTSQLSSFLCFTGWMQFNGIHNINNRCLDLVISSSNCSVSRAEPLSLPEDKHHPALSVNVNICNLQPSLRPPPRLVRRFHTANATI